jgi:hypothetical protein
MFGTGTVPFPDLAVCMSKFISGLTVVSIFLRYTLSSSYLKPLSKNIIVHVKIDNRYIVVKHSEPCPAR